MWRGSNEYAWIDNINYWYVISPLNQMIFDHKKCS